MHMWTALQQLHLHLAFTQSGCGSTVSSYVGIRRCRRCFDGLIVQALVGSTKAGQGTKEWHRVGGEPGAEGGQECSVQRGWPHSVCTLSDKEALSSAAVWDATSPLRAIRRELGAVRLARSGEGSKGDCLALGRGWFQLATAAASGPWWK